MSNGAEEREDVQATGGAEEVPSDKYLTFPIGDEEYGINIQFVTEIVGIQKITDVPDTPAYVRGVINLRGKVIPVIDVRLRFGLPEREYDERTCIIVVNYNSMAVGLIVDAVSEVLDIPSGDVQPPPKVNKGAGSRYIQGLGKVEEQVKILLDIERLLYDDEMGGVLESISQD
jgi:purine-binding chemotaxis protein CheW